MAPTVRIAGVDFVARAELAEAIVSWHAWLAHERRASAHTVAAYLRDLAAFLAFLTAHLGAPPGLDELAELRPADFRAYLARRAAEERAKTSTARALSVLRSFFRHLERTGVLSNSALSAVRGPRLPRAAPRPLAPAEARAVMRLAGKTAAGERAPS